ncbi:hypothetical protein TGAM01_v200289 [Trichoderma gamsii]|uniref:RTA1 domain-containing protein n=1 Tax=Trichoderma gamsii TaxID=398673 RepID=A0A2P5A2W6_9HYPO|nr:hypothetical protein TGAM01_v200289 [Trichoderma gamsii]PON30869.1 hypothetical protein TGAM01_v200289 [Trichoderma gamsii]
MAFENYKPSLDDPNAWVPYRYYPSVPAAAIFIALYSIVTIAHIAIIVTSRTWSFTPFIIGGLFELVGYIGRVISAKDIWALGPYIVQSILLLVAPALFAASIYIILGQIMVFVGGEQFSLVPRRWLTKVFVAGDVVSFLLQMAGGGIQAAGTLEFLNLGEKIITAGLFAQIVFFGFFIVVAIVFQVRFARHQAASDLRLAKWKKHMYTLYIGSLLIMVRSIFRVVEYLMGNNGFLLRHEYLVYIFDATLMFLVMLLFLWVHPRQLRSSLSSEESSYILDVGANNSLKQKGSSHHQTHRDTLPIHPAKESSSPVSVTTRATSTTTTATAARLPQSRLPAAASRPCHSPLGRAEESDGAIPTYTIKDMALLHHWTWSTSQSVADFPDVSRYWQTVFPQIAFEHTFVMHAILSLAALHQAYLYPERRKQLTLEAMRYHSQALQGFQRGIERMNDSNSDALFACSSLNIIYVFAMYGQLYDDAEFDMTPAARKSRILGAEWLPMVRGVQAILDPVYQRVRFGPLSSLLSIGNWDHLDPDSERVADDERFRSLGNLWAESTGNRGQNGQNRL